jgi:hypothetical protein
MDNLEQHQAPVQGAIEEQATLARSGKAPIDAANAAPKASPLPLSLEYWEGHDGYPDVMLYGIKGAHTPGDLFRSVAAFDPDLVRMLAAAQKGKGQEGEGSWLSPEIIAEIEAEEVEAAGVIHQGGGAALFHLPKPIDPAVLREFFKYSWFNTRKGAALFVRCFAAKGFKYPETKQIDGKTQRYYHRGFHLHGSTSGISPIEALTTNGAGKDFAMLNAHCKRAGALPESIGFVTCQLRATKNSKGKTDVSNRIDCWDGSSIWTLEFDNGTREQQEAWLAALNLPMSLVDTGGKSLHAYIETTDFLDANTAADLPLHKPDAASTFDEGHEVTGRQQAILIWEEIRDLLWEAVARTSGQWPDPSAMKLVQVMRLPGSVHPATGRLATVVRVEAPRLSILDLHAHLAGLCTAGTYGCARTWKEALKAAEEHGQARTAPAGAQKRKRRQVDDDNEGVNRPTFWGDLLESIERPRPWIDELPICERKKVLTECLEQFPPRVPGSQTYSLYRDLLMGIARTVGPDEISWVVELFNEHSPEWNQVDESFVADLLSREQGYNAGTVLNATRQRLKDPHWLPPSEVARRADLATYDKATGYEYLAKPKAYLENVWPVRKEQLMARGADVRRIWASVAGELRSVRLDPEYLLDSLPEAIRRHLGLPAENALPSDNINTRSAAAWGELIEAQGCGSGSLFQVPDHIPRNGVTVLFGPAGGGKTTQVLRLAAAAMFGTTFGDSKEPCLKLPAGKNVLYVVNDDQDGGPQMVVETLKKLPLSEGQAQELLARLDIWGRQSVDDWVGGDLFSFTPDRMVELAEKLRSGSYGVLVVDSLKRSCSLSPLPVSVYQQTGLPWLSLFSTMARAYGVTTILIHHTNKGRGADVNRAGGLTDIVETVQAAHFIDYKGEDAGGTVNTEWHVLKCRGAHRRTYTLRQHQDGTTGIEPQGEARNNNCRGEILALLSCNDGSRSTAEILHALSGKWGESNVRNNLPKLEKEGRIVSTRVGASGIGGQAMKHYQLAEETTSAS